MSIEGENISTSSAHIGKLEVKQTRAEEHLKEVKASASAGPTFLFLSPSLSEVFLSSRVYFQFRRSLWLREKFIGKLNPKEPKGMSATCNMSMKASDIEPSQNKGEVGLQ